VEAPPIVHEVLASSGRPLDAGTRAFMAKRFGHDFSRVRVHADAQAAASAQAVGARAYTVEHDVVFGAGQFAPGTAAGRWLLAHELVHTLQQQGPGNEVSGEAAHLQRAGEEPPSESEGVPKREGDCSGWLRDDESFAIALARHHLREQNPKAAPGLARKVDCRRSTADEHDCEVHFSDGTVVRVRWGSKIQTGAETLKPPAGMVCFYRFSCTPDGRIVFRKDVCIFTGPL
jgi:hypothetical protein